MEQTRTCADQYQNEIEETREFSDETCNCLSQEINRVCASDGSADITYSWNYEYCGEEFTQAEEDSNCSCLYSEWQNEECLGDGFRKQTRTQTSQFEYCTVLEQNTEDPTCSEPEGPVCGNEILEEGEECDDGNNQNGDGCSSTCQTEEETEEQTGGGETSPAAGTGGGGGGSVPVFNLAISTKENKEIQSDTVTVTWFTNTLATSRVIYDTVSHPSLGEPPNYGYAYSTTEDSNKVTFHSVTIEGLTPGTTYFWRAISHASPEIISDELSFTTNGVLGEEEVSLEEIGEKLNELQIQLDSLRAAVEEISPKVPEVLAAEELPAEEAKGVEEIQEKVSEEDLKVEEKIVGENPKTGLGIFLAAIGAIPVNLKIILILAGVILIGLLILRLVRKKKKKE